MRILLLKLMSATKPVFISEKFNNPDSHCRQAFNQISLIFV